uniref:Uncharacterized protein n=1 Tax=Panagrolaimus sp. ES5 TaxID=591445 RepID=A0AC34FYJ8_9BILA
MSSSSSQEAMAEIKSYIGNRDELDPEAIKSLRLERVGQEPENLDVFQRMEKKGVPTAEVLVSFFCSGTLFLSPHVGLSVDSFHLNLYMPKKEVLLQFS